MGRLLSAGMRRAATALLFVGLASISASAPAQAEFGFNNLDITFTNADGSTASQAGTHPFAMTTSVEVNSTLVPKVGYVPDGETKNLTFEQVPGLVGDPSATPRCPTADFIKRVEGRPSCQDSSALGIATLTAEFEPLPGPTKLALHVAVYNLVPPPGVAAKIGFVLLNVPITIDLSVSPNPPYNVVASLTNIPQVLLFYGTSVTLWGDPASPEHDAYRGNCVGELVVPTADPVSLGKCPANIPERAFLTMPRACTGPLATTLHATSWERPGEEVTNTVLTHDDATPPNPLGMIGCGGLGFKPTIDAKPTSVAAESPTGLDFTLDVHDEGLTSASGTAQSDIRKVTVALPQAMSVNPALAEGLTACSEADLAREAVRSAPGEGCPDASKIGTVEVETPLLEPILKGSLFLAKPYENPFRALLGLYVVIRNPETGVLLRIAGEVVPDETTGQLVSVFDDLPQLPFSHFRLHFREGQRSPLATPPACRTYTTHADLVPWANPGAVLHDTASFEVTSGIGGGPCPAGGVPPFKPGLAAGTSNNSAGSYSPVDIRIIRNDGEQEITGISSLLPPGLTANLSGVPFCSQAQIAQARSKSGAQEEADPSCPAASQIGHTLVGVGVGAVLAYTPGRLYMAGPYEGAPFSVVEITSAKVGPFDLGTVVVHLPLNIDPVTAQVSIPAGAADQIPHIIKGIVVHVRDIRVYVDRPGFTVNPTNCDPLSLDATVYGSGQDFVSAADDVAAPVAGRFQAANCANLAFKPSFTASTSSNRKTSRTDGASLSVKLSYPKGSFGKDANIRSVKVSLPKQLPSRLSTLQQACPDSVFSANPAACPSGSRVGAAKALTPILPVPLEGPAYFVSHGGAKFPELIVVLQGYGVTIDLHGETFISKAWHHEQHVQDCARPASHELPADAAPRAQQRTRRAR